MNRRRIVLTAGGIIALALSFSAGLSLQRYALADERAPRGECLILERDLKEYTYITNQPGFEPDSEGDRLVERYNRLCR